MFENKSKFLYILAYVIFISIAIFTFFGLLNKSTLFINKKYKPIENNKQCVDHLRTIHVYSNPFIYALMISECSAFIIFTYLLFKKVNYIFSNIAFIIFAVFSVSYIILYCFIDRNITVDRRYVNNKIF